MVWDMQDALDELIKESNSQMNYLDDIDGILNAIENRMTTTSEINTFGKSNISPILLHSEDENSNTSIEKTCKFPILKADKCVQVGKPSDDIYTIRELEKKHYRYMLEAFKNLRFRLEISSNTECIYPKDIDKEFSNDFNKVKVVGNTREINNKIDSLIFRGNQISNVILPTPIITPTLSRTPVKASLPTLRKRKQSLADVKEIITPK